MLDDENDEVLDGNDGDRNNDEDDDGDDDGEGGGNGDVGHSWSLDGVTWSNITCAYNMSRPSELTAALPLHTSPHHTPHPAPIHPHQVSIRRSSSSLCHLLPPLLPLCCGLCRHLCHKGNEVPPGISTKRLAMNCNCNPNILTAVSCKAALTEYGTSFFVWVRASNVFFFLNSIDSEIKILIDSS